MAGLLGGFTGFFPWPRERPCATNKNLIQFAQCQPFGMSLPNSQRFVCWGLPMLGWLDLIQQGPMEWQQGAFTASPVIRAHSNWMVVLGVPRQSYWASGESPPQGGKFPYKHSLNFSLLPRADQIGYARWVSESLTFGYLTDVVLCCRSIGAGSGQMAGQACRVSPHPSCRGFAVWMLDHRRMPKPSTPAMASTPFGRLTGMIMQKFDQTPTARLHAACRTNGPISGGADPARWGLSISLSQLCSRCGQSAHPPQIAPSSWCVTARAAGALALLIVLPADIAACWRAFGKASRCRPAPVNAIGAPPLAWPLLFACRAPFIGDLIRPWPSGPDPAQRDPCCCHNLFAVPIKEAAAYSPTPGYVLGLVVVAICFRQSWTPATAALIADSSSWPGPSLPHQLLAAFRGLCAASAWPAGVWWVGAARWAILGARSASAFCCRVLGSVFSGARPAVC